MRAFVLQAEEVKVTGERVCSLDGLQSKSGSRCQRFSGRNDAAHSCRETGYIPVKHNDCGERRSAEGSKKRKGAARIRTGDKGFAILCLSHLATAPVAPQAERSQRGAAT